MKDLGITKGEWTPENYAGYILIQIGEGYNKPNILDMEEVGEEQVRANMNLIIDAGNTAQKCGLLPSELLRQRDELKEALIEMMWQFAYRGTYEGRENLHTGGLLALEDAFSALGISDPITVIDFEAAIKSTEQ